jgi:archaemetzincin
MFKLSVCIWLGLLLITGLQSQHFKTNSTTPKATVTIDVQPFSDIPKHQVDAVLKALQKVYPNVTLLPAIVLPKQAYNAARNRYRADTLIGFLNKRTPNMHVTIGLTAKDISTTKNNIADWGIMGLGFCPGNACIVSTFRLHKQQLQEQLFKTAIHEIGHTQGLKHCTTKYCFMRDAEGKNTTNEQTDFCPSCKRVLVNKGWVF